MDGFGITLNWFREENIVLEVPFFQRPYVWDEENWSSLVLSINNRNAAFMPFLGSFILQVKEDRGYWIIDGQQRITTLSLFVKALLDCYKKFPPRVQSLLEDIILKTDDASDIDNLICWPRLKLAYCDNKDYELLMKSPIDENEVKKLDSKIAKCYMFFVNFFNSLTEEELKNIANKLLRKEKYIIAITLDKNDDEQEIFDTVNSLGKRLTNSDIVKNYMYQRMKTLSEDNGAKIKMILEHYKKYWENVFYDGDRKDFWDARISLGRITTTNLDSFLKDYGTIKGIYVPSENGGYEGLAKQYKAYINKLNFDELEAFSKELSSYADVYYKMKKDYADCNDFRITDYMNSTLLILDKLEITTFNPYVLQLKKTGDQDISKKLFALQRFVLKRFCWKASIKNYNKICSVLLSADNPIGYLESYNDNTVDVAWDCYPLGLKTIKNSPATLILFLVEMIRRNKAGEDKYSDPLLYNKTLEHIMPQRWEKNWSDVPSYILNQNNEYEIVSDYEQKVKNRKSKIMSIGNMTLLSSKLNTSISNDSFEYKINGKKGKGIKYFMGSLSVAKEIVDDYDLTKAWDERNIFDRELSLFDELNQYYNFVDEIRIGTSDNYQDDELMDLSVFDEKFFDNMRVGELARVSFSFLLHHHLLSAEEVLKLQDIDFSVDKLSCAYPVLTKDKTKLNDQQKRSRYYKVPIVVDGENYYLCSQWYEHDRKYLVPFVKDKIQIK